MNFLLPQRCPVDRSAFAWRGWKGLARNRQWQQLGASLLVAVATLLTTARVTPAAEKIFFKQGSLIRSLSVESLETFAETGTVNGDLAFYFSVTGASEEEQAAFRNILQESVSLEPNLIAQFFYSDIGERILAQFGDIVETRAGLNGQLALRAALIQSAYTEEGLNLLTFLRSLPTDMQVNLKQLQALSSSVERLIAATQTTVEELQALNTTEAIQEFAVDYDDLPDLRDPGGYGVRYERWQLQDESRDRDLYVDVYYPQTWREGQTPVVVFSHGLASEPQSYRKLAEHLASYGFLVAMPQHPGSDLRHTEDFRLGLEDQIFLTSEFIDRPLDISFVIDELERRNDSQFEGRLNLNRVGAAGHSFGGYTALAVGGAVLNFDHLQKQCNQRFAYLNVSLLLQCQALELPRQDYNFRDPRVQAVWVQNPVDSSLFGPEGLAEVMIPVAIVAGSYDPAAPVVFEQFRSFPWLGTDERLLGLIEGQAHVDLSELDVGLTRLLDSVPGLTLASPDLVQNYANAFATAFLGRYVMNRVDYRLYLRSSYATYLSQGETFKLYIISSLSDADLQEPLRDPILPTE